MLEEDWVTYIRRATHRSEELATGHGALDWVAVQRQRKWSLAGKTARRSDGRWSTRLLTWQPWFRASPKWDDGRPKKRWDDDLAQLAGATWTDVAKEASLWQALEVGYVEKLR